MRPWLYSSRKWLLCGTLMVRSTFLLVQGVYTACQLLSLTVYHGKNNAQ